MVDDPPDSFSEACGLSGSLRVRLECPGSAGESLLESPRPFLVVGRHGRADLRIDSTEVSQLHAYFQVVAGRVFCVDLVSRTGVRWDGGARPVGWVDRGRVIEVGPARLCFEGDEPESTGQGGALPISRSFEWPALPEARLDFLGAESGRPSWQVSRALVLIGRSPTCRVRLDNPEVARVQASLVRTPAGVWVVDLLGRENGLLVGGVPTRFARLEDGDVIGLGGHQIRVRIGRASPPSGRSELVRTPRGERGRPARSRVGPLADLGPKARGRGLEGEGHLLDPATERLFDQFDRMHQQTTEQFRQAILMMFRMHQDQMELIREELSRLDRLEEELTSLKAEMARGDQPRPARVPLRLVSGEPGSSPLTPEAPRPARAHPEPGRALGAGPPEAPAPAAPNPPSAGRRDVGGPTAPPDPDLHDLLSRRLAEIQDERQGLWKRLLGSLTGGEAGRAFP